MQEEREEKEEGNEKEGNFDDGRMGLMVTREKEEGAKWERHQRRRG